jgi:hypothetical protein
MATIQWRPEVNALTTPQSYRLLFIPRNYPGTNDLAARLAAALPNYSEEEFRTFLAMRNQIIQDSLINGEQLTEENAFTYSVSFTGRLDSPDDPLPPLEECLQVRVHASPPFIAAIRQAAKTERLPMEKRLPLISTAQDTLFKLNDVLTPQGVLQLAGEDLYFDPEGGSGGCVIEGTAGGRAVQTRFPMISSTAVMLMPNVPVQAHPWNNEYTVSVSTHYSEHGTLRTGTYGRMLRSPLTLTKMGHPNPPEVGILTGSAVSAQVSVTGGAVAADEMLRIQVILDLRQDCLLFNLIDMKEEGRAGAAVTVTANGALTLQGFSGSAVSSLSIRVNSYAALKDMIHNNYGGRLVDVLEVKVA